MRLLAAMLFAVGLAAVVGECRAQVSLSVYGLSKHSDSPYCEANPGLGINYQITEDLRLGHGRFLNSKCKWSNGTGIVYTPLKLGDFRFGVAVLRLTGYKEKAVFAPLPVGSYEINRRHAIDFFFAHKDEESVVGAAWRITF
jgi:hypothetical protein